MTSPGQHAVVLTVALLLAAGPAIGQPKAAPGPTAVQRAPAPAKSSVIPSRSAIKAPPKRRLTAGPATTVATANARARDWPTPAAYVNSAIYYDYEPGRIYTVTTSPRFLTTIALRPGEKLISKAAGDTVRWVMGETLAGSGATEQVIIFVKPIRPDLRTNIVLTTDQRTYLIDATSGAGPAYTSVLSWNYPQEQARLAAAQSAGQVAIDVDLGRLDFSYEIRTPKGRAPRWAPVRVFDDGTKTFIAFPPDLATHEAPPFFVLGPKDEAELVNYRVQGAYYVVDRLIERGELRLGEKPQAIVRITRTRPRS